MNKGKSIFSIGQIIMIIGSIAYILDLLFVESSKYSTLISARYGAAFAQKLPGIVVGVLAVVYAIAIVLMLIVWLMKRREAKQA